MIAYKIKSGKDFSGHLFLSDTFDRFLLSEAVFNIPFSVSIDGSLPDKNFESHIPWGSVRAICTQLIRGKEPPKSFHIVLRLSSDNQQKTLASIDNTIRQELVSGLFINIRYENDSFLITNGTAVSDFSVIRPVGEAWDRLVLKFLSRRGIEFEEP